MAGGHPRLGEDRGRWHWDIHFHPNGQKKRRLNKEGAWYLLKIKSHQVQLPVLFFTGIFSRALNLVVSDKKSSSHTSLQEIWWNPQDLCHLCVANSQYCCTPPTVKGMSFPQTSLVAVMAQTSSFSLPSLWKELQVFLQKQLFTHSDFPGDFSKKALMPQDFSFYLFCYYYYYLYSCRSLV